MATKYLDYTGLQSYHGKLKTNIIDPINSRIDEIVNVGGEPNVIEAVKINENTFAIADKTASLGMNLAYDSTNKKIKLTIGTEVQEIDAADFIKDGMLDSATYNADTKSLVLTFNTISGKDPITVDISDLVDTYALQAGAATTGAYLTLTPGVSGTGAADNPWKVTVALDETKLSEKLNGYYYQISNSTTSPFSIACGNADEFQEVELSGLKEAGLTKATTATYETLTTTNTGTTFTNVMQKFLANDIDLNTRLISVEGTVGGLGSAATKDETYFAKAAHTHNVDDVLNGTQVTGSGDSVIVTTLNASYNLRTDLGVLLSNDGLLKSKVTALETTVGGLGSAATKDETYFAKASHAHVFNDVLTDSGVSATGDTFNDIIGARVDGNNVLDILLSNDKILKEQIDDITAITEEDITALFA